MEQKDNLQFRMAVFRPLGWEQVLALNAHSPSMQDFAAKLRFWIRKVVRCGHGKTLAENEGIE